METLGKHMRGEISMNVLEYRLLNKAGTYTWVYLKAVTVQSFPNGLPKHIVGMMMDVTKSRSSTERLRSLLERAPIGMCEITSDLRLSYVNEEFCRIYGMQKHECLTDEYVRFKVV